MCQHLGNHYGQGDHNSEAVIAELARWSYELSKRQLVVGYIDNNRLAALSAQEAAQLADATDEVGMKERLQKVHPSRTAMNQE